MTRTYEVEYTGDLQALCREARKLAEAKGTLYGYVKHVIIEQREGWQDGAHIRLLCDTIQTFLESSPKRGLCISMPPRHMKSTIVSNALPAWYMSNYPQRDMIMASYAVSLARDNGRACRALMDDPMHKRIWTGQRFEVDSADAYQLVGKENGRPNLVIAGVGGPITGKGADLFVIDDPIKSMEDAMSDAYKRRLRDWFSMVALSRLSPTGKIILVMTRWTDDDLAGTVLRDSPDDWESLNLPAISDDGKPLWPERFDRAFMDRQRSAMGERAFSAQYQGRPLPASGGLFKREWFREGPRLGSDARRVRYWDKASTHGGGDWTVGCLMAYDGSKWVIEDIVRLRGSPHEVQETVRGTAERDGPSVAIRMEQEPGSSGVDVIDMYRQILAGYDFRPEKVTGDKVSRAAGLAAQMEAGAVDIVSAVWTTPLEDELLSFPAGAHDDQVDACSGAFRALSLTVRPRASYLF
jgi:predicted phage terminase large subunit-like protein